MSLTWHRSWMPRQGNLHDKSLKMITNCLVEVLTKVLLVKYCHSSFYPTKPLTMKKKSGICGSFGCVPTLRYGAGAKKTACLEVYRNLVARRSGKLTLSALLVCEECEKSSLFP